MPIKRRPQTYPAFLSEVHYVLKGLLEGTEFKRKNNIFYLGGYEVRIENDIMKFYRYDKEFMYLQFDDSNSFYTNLHIICDTWSVKVLKDYTFCGFELPLSKDDHFNASMLEEKLPEWEDMQKINSIMSIAKELKLFRLYCFSENFYP